MTAERAVPATWDPPEVLARRNRRIIADRLNWPNGVVQVCERVERWHPEWAVTWMDECTSPGFERPAGYWATRRVGRSREVYGASARKLIRAIKRSPRPRWI